MLSRYAAPLLLAAAIAVACGPRSHASTPEPSATAATVAAVAAAPHTATHGHHVVPNEPKLDSRLEVNVRDGVALALRVTNVGEKHLELQFPTGQTHDFAILDATGREVWRWSEGRMFTTALQSHVLESTESATYEDRWDAAAHHGAFVAVATLSSSNFPVEARVPFTLP